MPPGPKYHQSRVPPQLVGTMPPIGKAISPDVTGTTSLTRVMAGFGITCRAAGVAPKLLVIVGGQIVNSSGGDGGVCQLAWGTGAAPSNGDAAQGTTAGNTAEDVTPSAGSAESFCRIALITPGNGVDIWIDLQFASYSGGTCTLPNCYVTVVELTG